MSDVCIQIFIVSLYELKIINYINKRILKNYDISIPCNIMKLWRGIKWFYVFIHRMLFRK